MKQKLKIHLFTLPRWFAAPFFGCALLIGVALAGGSFGSLYTWLGFIAGMCIMAGGHSFNSYLDYAWTGLDKGEMEDRSAEKGYTGGQSIIAQGLVSTTEVFFNAIAWYALAFIPLIIISLKIGPMIYFIGVLGMLITFWYCWGKFNYTHEIALGVGVGPIAVLIGMFSVSGSPPWVDGLIVSAPFAIILCFAGLAFDEWPDAEANLKKGVKSISYMVWKNNVDLSSYLAWWIGIMYIYQVFLITLGILAPLTGITFFLVFPLFAILVMLKGEFDKFAGPFVLTAALYPTLLFIGQALS